MEGVNSIIKEAVEGMADWGVHYVNSYIPQFAGHLWCDPVPDFKGKTDLYVSTYHSNAFQDFGSQQYFWSRKSKFKPPVGPKGEGKDHPIQFFELDLEPREVLPADDFERTSPFLEKLIPDPNQRAKVYAGEADPGDFNPEALKDFDSFRAAVIANPTDDPELDAIFHDGWFRVWHPKGTAQGGSWLMPFSKRSRSRAGGTSKGVQL